MPVKILLTLFQNGVLKFVELTLQKCLQVACLNFIFIFIFYLILKLNGFFDKSLTAIILITSRKKTLFLSIFKHNYQLIVNKHINWLTNLLNIIFTCPQRFCNFGGRIPLPHFPVPSLWVFKLFLKRVKNTYIITELNLNTMGGQASCRIASNSGVGIIEHL